MYITKDVDHIQEKEPSNVNYPSSSFPTDIWLTKRPFMWVNIFWLVMPFYTIMYYIFDNWKNKRQLRFYF